jgi:WD40 repeat protein
VPEQPEVTKSSGSAASVETDSNPQTPTATVSSAPSTHHSREEEEEEEESEDDDNQWLQEEEKLSLLLDAGEEIKFHYNALRVQGMEEISCVLVLCPTHLYIIDDFQIDAKGKFYEIVPNQNKKKGGSSQHLQLQADSSSGALPDGADFTLSEESGRAVEVARHRCTKWRYSEVVELQRRRYLLRPSALEFFFSDGTSAMVVLNITQRPLVWQKLLAYCPVARHFLPVGAAPGSGGVTGSASAGDLMLSRFGVAGSAANPSSLTALGTPGPTLDLLLSNPASASIVFASLAQETSKHKWLRSVTARWQMGAITNFEYLMSLNTLAGRTYNDLTQYPVFPWVLRDYDSPTLNLHNHKVFRDLSKPMGALSEPRAKDFMARYRDSDVTLHGMGENEDEEVKMPRFHYGTHYSSAAVVLYFLLRLEPYTQQAISLQSGHFDRADRLFSSLSRSWKSAAETSTSDVKEMIPEFYYAPEMLLNGNRLELGKPQTSNVPLDHVELPAWSSGSARQFVRLHRQALESEFVSAHLHEWIDLIFGYKQRGPAAVEALNVFYYLTYGGQVDIDKIADPLLREATIEQIRSFGQTPKLLFAAPHPPRLRLPHSGDLFLHCHRLQLNDSLPPWPHAIGGLWCTARHDLIALRPHCALRAPLSHYSGLDPTAPVGAGGISLSGGLIGAGSGASAVSGAGASGPLRFVSWGFVDGTLRTGIIERDVSTVSATAAIAAAAAAAGASAAAASASASSSSVSSASASAASAALLAASTSAFLPATTTTAAVTYKLDRVYLNMHDCGPIRFAALTADDPDLLVTAGNDLAVSVWRWSTTIGAGFGAENGGMSGGSGGGGGGGSGGLTGGGGSGSGGASGGSEREGSAAYEALGGAGAGAGGSGEDKCGYELVRTLYGHRLPVTCMVLSKPFGVLCTGAGDGCVIVWDVNRLVPIRQFRAADPNSTVGCPPLTTPPLPFADSLVPAPAYEPEPEPVVAVVMNQSSADVIWATPSALFVYDANGHLLATYNNAMALESGAPHPSFLPPPPPAQPQPLSAMPAPNARSAAAAPPPPVNSATLPLVPFAPITALTCADTAGYEMANSCNFIVTGHSDGSIRVWYVCLLLTPAVPTPTAAASAAAALAAGDTAAAAVQMVSAVSPDFPLQSSAAQNRVLAQLTDQRSLNAAVVPGLTPAPAPLPMSTASASGHAPLSSLSASASVSVAGSASASIPEGNETPQLSRPVSATTSGTSSTTTTSVKKVLQFDEKDSPLSTASVSATISESASGSGDGGAVDSVSSASTSASVSGSTAAAVATNTAAATATSTASTAATSSSAAAAPAEPATPILATAMGERWQLVPVVCLTGHHSPVTALWIAPDRHSIWSGDSAGRVLQWALPEHARGALNRHSPVTTGPPAATQLVPLHSQCTCKFTRPRASKTAKHETERDPIRYFCSQPGCKELLCEWCRLDHLRTAHPLK